MSLSIYPRLELVGEFRIEEKIAFYRTQIISCLYQSDVERTNRIVLASLNSPDESQVKIAALAGHNKGVEELVDVNSRVLLIAMGPNSLQVARLLGEGPIVPFNIKRLTYEKGADDSSSAEQVVEQLPVASGFAKLWSNDDYDCEFIQTIFTKKYEDE
ncbi:hypothetical protein KEM48_004368 [Puccinia striiformis f. sp. tritici PST-130]|nr:hypothetical protein KEM48_004368 [Puccinia striiformis f. sp. tritici PST-130]